MYQCFHLSLTTVGAVVAMSKAATWDKDKTGKIDSQRHKLFNLHNPGQGGRQGRKRRRTNRPYRTVHSFVSPYFKQQLSKADLFHREKHTLFRLT